MATPLKVALVENDLSQEKFASLMGMSSTAVSAMVREKSKPDVVTALRVAKLLGKTVEELWGHLLDSGQL